jgi:hypothetical protein
VTPPESAGMGESAEPEESAVEVVDGAAEPSEEHGRRRRRGGF